LKKLLPLKVNLKKNNLYISLGNRFKRFVIKLVTNKIETEEQKRKILLGTYLIVIYFLVDLFFFIVNLFNPQGIPWVLISGALVSLACLAILRLGYIEFALLLFLIRANAIIFYFSIGEGTETGSFLFYISYALTPLAFFGYKDRWKGITYSVVTFTLFLIAQFKPSEFSPDQAHFYFISNFTIVLFTTGFIFLFFDRINREAEKVIIQKNEELEKANEELDRFVYSASHDLRSPLASILGLTKIYSEQDTSLDRKKVIDMISNRAQKLDAFIGEILAYSQNSRTGLKIEKINLHTVFDECLESLSYMPNFSLIEFKTEISSENEIYTDAGRLKIILTNLFSNSVKYFDKMKDKSTIKISTSTKEKEWKILIEDNGIGIPAEHHEKIFDMFYRAHAHSDGSGLGLYIAKECLKKMGGAIHIHSTVGIGTIAEISIPRLMQ
jgi:hypothetical protein